MKKIKVSVIIPFYNAENVLKRCLDTILVQTEENIEIICVNYGSEDNSENLLKTFKDERIIIINQENQDLAKARLKGAEFAHGEYICFVDADDYIDCNYIKDMYENAIINDSDIVVCGFCREDKDSGRIYSKEMLRSGIINVDNMWEDCIEINPAMWNKLYKAYLFKKLVHIQKYPRIMEDAVIFSLLLLHTKKISFVNKILYHYLINYSNNLLSTFKIKDIEEICDCFLETKKQYVNKTMEELLDIYAFVHLGIGLTYKLIQYKEDGYRQEIKKIITFLNENFSTWRTTKRLSLGHAFLVKKNMKIAILRFVIKNNLYILFFNIYNKITNKLKIDIKW